PRRGPLLGGKLERRGRGLGEVDGTPQRRRRVRLVLPGHGALAARQQGRAPHVVRQGRRLDGQERSQERGTSPLPGGGRGIDENRTQERLMPRRTLRLSLK